MTPRSLPKLMRPALRYAVLLVFCVGTAGCLLPGEGSRTLTFRPDNRQIDYEYNFTQAYAAPSPEGGYDMVLLSGYAPQSSSSGKRVYPASTLPNSQIVRLHVAWRPGRGSKNDYPAATNATIQWHVFHRERGATPSRVSYDGTGYAAVELGEDTTLFEFRDIHVHPSEIVGNVHDPLGSSQVFGSIRADNDATTVRELLSQLERDLAGQSVSPATAPATEPAGTPPARKTAP